MLKQLLGLDGASGPSTPQEMQMEAQRLQMMAQMQMEQQQRRQQQQQQNQGGGSGTPKPVTAEDVFLVADYRTNTIFVNAPKDKMSLIARTIEMLDTPPADVGLAAAGGAPRELKRYSLVTISPEALLVALREIGNLDPLTQLRTDTKSRTLFAFASASDHTTIGDLIDKLDGSGRQFDVIPLRKHPADQVAGTIHALMVGKEEKKQQQRRYSWWDDYNRSDDDEQPNKGFRVDADIEQNRLLLWATADEIAEVRRFLAKMGEPTAAAEGGSTVRVLSGRDADQTRRLLESIRRRWQDSGNRPVVIEGLEHLEVTPAPPAPKSPPPADSAAEGVPVDRTTRTSGKLRFSHLAQYRTPLPPSEDAAARSIDAAPPTSQPPPGDANQPWKTSAALHVTITPDGRIVIASADPALLNEIEELADALTPRPREFEIFTLHNARAYWVKWNLTDYFEEELKDDKDDDSNYWRGWYGFTPGNEQQSTPLQLSRRRKLSFISDSDTNTILVRNASPDQLEIIRELIELYDSEVEINEQNARHTRVFAIKYSQAKVISAAIKEVYRDLLSSKDKEFEGGEQNRQGGENRTYITNFGQDSDSKRPTETPVSFKGLISIGVDEISNTLLDRLAGADEQRGGNGTPARRAGETQHDRSGSQGKPSRRHEEAQGIAGQHGQSALDRRQTSSLSAAGSGASAGATATGFPNAAPGAQPAAAVPSAQ